tara:strand:+ start:287 stop:667 length:381 start_codon:yes stop_codon:yes gene_type:complete
MNTDDDDFKITIGGTECTISAPDGTGLMFPEHEYTYKGIDNTYTLSSSPVTTVSGVTVGGCIDTHTSFTGGLGMDLDVEFDDNWPSESKILDMIEEYPALKLQYTRFLEVYNLVRGDFNHGKDILE